MSVQVSWLKISTGAPPPESNQAIISWAGLFKVKTSPSVLPVNINISSRNLIISRFPPLRVMATLITTNTKIRGRKR